MRSLELTYRLGDHKVAPERADLERALAEIFQEPALGLSEADLAEHPSCWLTLGWDAGNQWTVLTVDIYRSGLAILSKYADQDDADPDYEYRLSGVDESIGLQLWGLLAQAAEAELLARFKPEPEPAG
jgi:hypothetical protein